MSTHILYYYNNNEYIYVQTYRTCTKGELQCKLWTLDDNNVNFGS